MGEHRSNGERKYYLSNLPGDTPIKALAGAIKARWICEQAHQQRKEELGPDHFSASVDATYAFIVRATVHQSGNGPVPTTCFQ
ncbi:hypothetical protein EV664_101256 [Stakelama pacifica]|uniref:DDE family transposase n=1 Tax=Stakelama pacifica TaxID=517720 RepID=A0A4R6FZ55_9SPHN|nr:hypothetical protein EV664_101256 [Stakelama pacifica]GGO90357.1 hypothetical protein GCM10011329_02500 [Stakelama pacifica]